MSAKKVKNKDQTNLYIAVVEVMGGPAESAVKLGISRSTISRYLNGSVFMGAKTAEKCSEITGIDARALSPTLRAEKAKSEKYKERVNELAAKLL